MLTINCYRFKKPIIFSLVFLFSFVIFNNVSASGTYYGYERQPAQSKLNIEANSVTGAFVYSYPLVTPPGRNSLNPDLKLVYNNQDENSFSPFGVGWSINIPYIERINRKGSEKLYTENYYYSSLSGELEDISLSDSKHGSYGAKVDDGEFLKYDFKTNDSWEVFDKKGTKYTFGLATSTRQYDTASSTKIFKWLLEEVRDTNNNFIKYEYYKDGNQIYPDKIKYTGYDTTDGIFEVEFLRESRSDNATSTQPGFSIKTNYRINEIKAKVNGTWAKKYALSYTTGDNGIRSILDTITESGQNEQSNVVTLPADDFDYQTKTKSWTDDNNWSIPVYFEYNGEQGVRLADVNGDGLVDMIKAYGEQGSSDRKVFINNGDGTGWTYDDNWSIPVDFVYIGTDKGIRLADVNGDGLVDLIKGFENSKTVYINDGDGTGWTEDTGYSVPINFIDAYGDTGARLADVNGDGLIDIVRSIYKDGGSTRRVYINNGDGTGWTYDDNWSIPMDFIYSGADKGVRLEDINGDDLVDIIQGVEGTRGAYINNGDGTGWTYNNNYSIPVDFYNNGDTGVRLADVNGDGLIDIARSIYKDGGSTKRVYINNGDGTGWTYDDNWSIPVDFVYNGADQAVRLADVNGDGLVDFIQSLQFGLKKDVYIADGDKADVISNIENNKGAETQVNYRGSGEYLNSSDEQLNPSLPIILQTMESAVVDDGLGHIATTTYEYSGGHFYYNNPYDRKFSGFNKITKTDPFGYLTKNYYHQGNETASSSGEFSDDISKIGKIYRTEIVDNSNNIYSQTVNKWDKYDLSNGRNFVKLVQTMDMTYDGNNTHKDKAATYSYDNANGNLTQKVEFGEVTGSNDGTYSDSGTDDFTTTISYASNTSANILGLPSQQTVVDHSSNKVKETKYYYDTQSLGSVVKGNLTKQEDWKSGSTYVNSQKTYDGTYGLVTVDTDPRGKTTNYTYDSYHLYPTTITNALSQSTQYTYDYSSGKVKQKTDPNSRVFENVYDGLDRLITEKQPDFTTPATLVTKSSYTYTDTSGAVNIHKTDNLDASVAREIYQYFDGLGRLIQERKEAESSNYEVKDIAYNNRGLVDKESLNYFSTGTSKTAATTTAALYTNYSYDALSRLTSSVNSVGTTTNAYSDWKVTVTDANNKTKDLYKDAYNNFIQVDEHNSTSTYNTAYQYNYLGNLTKITDALDNVRNFTYDGLGRRLTAQDLHASADTSYGSWNYTYDDAGNLTQTVDPKSQTINYTYDDLNRQLTENYTSQAGTEITYSYDSGTDGIGRLTGITAANLTQANTYNPLGIIKNENKTINGTNYQTDYEYDRQGNQTLITYPDDTEVKYEFNAAGQLEKVSKKASGEQAYTEIINDYDYNPMGQTTFRQFENGAQNWNTYDADKLYRQSYRFTLLPDTGSSGSGMLLRALNENEAASAASVSKQTITKKMRDWYNKMSKASIKEFMPVSAIPTESLDSYNEATGSGTRSMLLLDNNSAPNWPTNQYTEGLWLSESLTFNSGFEDGFNNWTFYTANNATSSVDCTTSYSGDCSDKVIVSTSGNYWDSMVFQTLRLDANTNYKLKFKAKAATSTSTYVGANQNHDPWYVLGLHKSVNVGTDWKEYEYSFTSWSTDENARIYFGLGEHPGTYWFDDIELVPDNLNQVKNPSFENAFNDWSFWSYGNGGAAGTNSVICTDSTKGDCSDYIDMTASGDYWQAQLLHLVSVNSSDSYIVTFDAKAGAARNIGLALTQGHDPWWDLTSTTNVSLGTSWQSYEFELSPSQTDSNARLMFYLGTSAADVYIDNVRMWKKQNTRMTDMTPEFSAIYDDPDSGDIAPYYQIQVAGRYDTFNNPLWDSGKTALSTSVTEGNRTIDLSYAGNSLYEDGNKYHWRMRLWDDDDAPGAWSNGRDYFIMSGKRVQDVGYYYDNVGNITKIEDASDTNSTKTADYTYDDLNRLTQAEITDVADGQSRYTEDYTYNALGNILTKTGQGTYDYAGNQGTSYANPHAATSINSLTQSYDNNGNLTDDSVWDYTWDYRNRLIGATNGTTTVSYGYDQGDNRIWSFNGTATTTYPTKYYNVASTGTTTRQIFAGDELVATIEGTDTHYVHTDHLGGSSVISDADGNLEETTDYYPFGGIRLDEKEGAFNEQKKFTGYEYDSETGLNYAGARYQNGNVGRFISQDPVANNQPEKMLSDPQQLNMYSYGRNNPLVYTDPTGMYNTKTGQVEKGDTQSSIVGAINQTFNIKTDWATVQNVSSYSDRFQNQGLDKIVGQSLRIGTDMTTDITKQLNQLNQQRANISSIAGPASLLLFAPGKSWDIKNSNDNVLGKGADGKRDYWSYIYNGGLIRYDAPGNINYGYVSSAAGLSGSMTQAGAVAAQMGDNLLNGKVSSFSDNSGDSRYVQQGINSFNSNGRWWQKLLSR